MLSLLLLLELEEDKESLPELKGEISVSYSVVQAAGSLLGSSLPKVVHKGR